MLDGSMGDCEGVMGRVDAEEVPLRFAFPVLDARMLKYVS